MEHIDQCKRKVFLENTPKRIVSLVPSQTELLHDLGLEDEVVGITKFCIHPKVWFENKTRVGGTKKLHIDEIRQLKPDLIIANKEENSKHEIELLAEEFPVWISDVNNLEENYEMILSIGKVCGKEDKAKVIAGEIKSSFVNFKPLKPSIGCLYFIWQNPYMLASSGTFISSLMEKCGFNNLADQLGNRYPQATENDISKLQPELIFLSSEPYPFKEKHKLQMERNFPGSKVILVDGEMFSWYGSRLRYSAEYLQNLQTEVVESIQ